MKRYYINVIKLVTIVFFSISFSLPTFAKTFSDIPETHQFYNDIHQLSEENIINGYSDGTFKPHQPLTRGQAAKIITRTLNIDTENFNNPGFKDIPITHQYYKEIAALKHFKIIAGYEDNTFRPNAHIQRHHMAKILASALSLSRKIERLPFTDVPNEYKDYVAAIYHNNITKGKTVDKFDGKAIVTRGQMAAFIMRSKDVANIKKLDTSDMFLSNFETTYPFPWKEDIHDFIFLNNEEEL